MKTLFKLLFIAGVTFISIICYTQTNHSSSLLENVDALGQGGIEICAGTGTVPCNGKLAYSSVTVR
ncbi:MAG: hypothetical protein LIP06_03505 [Tannerellaceae bacterium]|nr:hypothetical protein [Tannerellaceae bacterium]